MSDALRQLPAVHELSEAAGRLGTAPRWAVVEAARRLVGARRQAIVDGHVVDPKVEASEVADHAAQLAAPSLRPVVNATGVIVHTNLGRAPLAKAALAAVMELGAGYCNLEYDIAEGKRGSRHDHASGLLADLCGAEAALVANNNAAAMVLALAGLARGREVVVSRGELVEIGGSFRIPDILETSGCRLVEVGTTNRTRISDYERAIGDDTRMLLKVHRSNFAMVGFTEGVGLRELAALSKARGLVSLMDLGSGALLPAAEQRRRGLLEEPSVGEAIATGVDVVCFSADKLLGGPQAGVMVGRRALIDVLRRHPLMRALRPDKLTIAALAATLRLYRDERAEEVPVIAMASEPVAMVSARAHALRDAIVGAAAGGTKAGIEVRPSIATMGGGTLPTSQIASAAVVIEADGGQDDLAKRMRMGTPAVIGRLEDNCLWLDVRTIDAELVPEVARAVAVALAGAGL